MKVGRMTYQKLAMICLILICVVLYYADEIDGDFIKNSVEVRK